MEFIESSCIVHFQSSTNTDCNVNVVSHILLLYRFLLHIFRALSAEDPPMKCLDLNFQGSLRDPLGFVANAKDG